MAPEKAEIGRSLNPHRFRTLLFALMPALLLSFPSHAESKAGSFTGLSGAVYFRAGGAKKWVIAEKKSPVNAGDSVRTGNDGRAAIRFADSSTLSIGNDTEVEITEFMLEKDERKATYTVASGKIRAFVSGFSGRTDFRVKTPTSTSGVKGTDFIVMNQGNANVIFGERDSVSVSGEDGAPVAVGQGAMTENTKGLGPIEPVKVEPGSALEEARMGLEALTDVSAPVEWERAGRLPDILARWNINYGNYLAGSGRFNDSLGVFSIAIDLSTLPAIRAEAHLGRGTVLSRNLGRPGDALTEYMTVVERYQESPFVENALFSSGMINMELGRKDEALGLFRRYIRDYPGGSHRETIELFIREMEK